MLGFSVTENVRADDRALEFAALPASSHVPVRISPGNHAPPAPPTLRVSHQKSTRVMAFAPCSPSPCTNPCAAWPRKVVSDKWYGRLPPSAKSVGNCGRAMSSGRMTAGPRRWRGKRQHGPRYVDHTRPLERRRQGKVVRLPAGKIGTIGGGTSGNVRGGGCIESRIRVLLARYPGERGKWKLWGNVRRA